LRESPHKAERWLCGYEAGLIANSMGKPLLALKFLRMSEKAIANRWEIAKHIGLAYASFERYDKALLFLVDSLKTNDGNFTFNPEPRNDGDTWDKIGYCFFQNNKHFEAKEAWLRAIEIGTDKMQVEMCKKRVAMLERQWGM